MNIIYSIISNFPLMPITSTPITTKPPTWQKIIDLQDIKAINAYKSDKEFLEKINEQMPDGTYPLHAAIRLGNAEMTHELLQCGADPTLCDNQNLTAYDYALLTQNELILSLLLPKKSVKALEKAKEMSSQTFFRNRKKNQAAEELQIKLLQFINECTKRPVDSFKGLHRVLIDGNLEAFNYMENIDVTKTNRTSYALTPLHCALLSRNEQLIEKVLSRLSQQDFLAKDKYGLTPVHYAAMLGLTNSMDYMLRKLKNDSHFDINFIHPRLKYSLANLAIASEQPGSLALLCRHGADLNIEDESYCSAADLLCLQLKQKDPLHITTSEYILAAYNLSSIVATLTLPALNLPLMLGSLALNATVTHGSDFRGQTLFWAGEIFSTMTNVGLAQFPLLKAGVDACRVFSIAAGSLRSIYRSLKGFKYEKEKTWDYIKFHGVIIATSFYRTKQSFEMIAKTIDNTITSYFERQEKLLLDKQNLQIRERQLRNEIVKLRQEKRDFANLNLYQKATYSQEPEALRTITFGTTYIAGNPNRDMMSAKVNENHKEYAQIWGLTHRVVTENLLKYQCSIPVGFSGSEVVDCSPYWNKIALLKGWLADTTVKTNEWYIFADDDMVVSNMMVDPYTAIDTLRKEHDTSFIVAEDSYPYAGKDAVSPNTGLLFVRKDLAAKELIEAIWEKRNNRAFLHDDNCPTLGYCKNQKTLHEQQALSEILTKKNSLIDRVVSIVRPRDSYEGTEIALNTFAREGSFTREEGEWESDCFDYSYDNERPYGKWKPMDWMGQASGLPNRGRYCENGKPSGDQRNIRQDRIEEMISQVYK